MKKFIIFAVMLYPSAVSAQHWRCWQHTRQPQVVQVPSADLGRLEALSAQIAAEQRWQSYIQHETMAYTRQIKDLLLIGISPGQSGRSNGQAAPLPADIRPAAPLPNPYDIRPAAPLPNPYDIRPAAPLPNPLDIPAAPPIPLPSQVPPAAPLPTPGGVQPAAPLPGPGFPPAGAISMRRAWPQVQR